MVERRNSSTAQTHWTAFGRWVVYLLASSSIACLQFDFYHLCPMRIFTLFIFVPAMLLLAGIAMFDRLRGDRRLSHAMLIGLAGGLVAAISYDIFRLPFVFAKEWGISSVVPPMALFKVFPRFGAMILGQPIEQVHYSAAAQTLGWIYHFSNGAAFGIMYMAIIGNPRARHWGWAVVTAVGIELGMLLTPYSQMFSIPITLTFIGVTLTAHVIFGVSLGQTARWLTNHQARSLPAA
jgi:hypothetical protein